MLAGAGFTAPPGRTNRQCARGCRLLCRAKLRLLMRPMFLQQIRSYFLFAFVALLGVPPAFSQHVETRNSGGGTKLELHYDAEGKVTETRTIGADGKLLEKDTLE